VLIKGESDRHTVGVGDKVEWEGKTMGRNKKGGQLGELKRAVSKHDWNVEEGLRRDRVDGYPGARDMRELGEEVR